MNEQEGILELVEMLYTMVSEAWGVPLGNDKCLVDRNKALDLIEEIKNQLPAEIAEAKSRELKRAMNAYVDEALKSAEDSMAQALDIMRQSRVRYQNAAGRATSRQQPEAE